MSDTSIFPDKEVKPTDKDLAQKLGPGYTWWKEIHQLTLTKYPGAISEWNFAGKKFGWSFRVKDKKRVIIYLLPRNRYFKIAFVFGEKAMKEILGSEISANIKTELQNAPKYAEGRGIRIEVKNDSVIPDIMQLIDIKLKN